MSHSTLKQTSIMQNVLPAVRVNPKIVLSALCIVSFILVLISFVGVVILHPYTGDPYTGDPAASTPTNLSKVVLRFDVMGEGNIPSWYSGSLLLISAVLLAAIAADTRTRQASYRERWTVLAVLFMLFSLDEIAYLHEAANTLLSQLWSSYLQIGWIIPGVISVFVAGLWFAPFLLNLPSKTKWLFIIAAFVYLSGALGLEVIDNFLMSEMDVQAAPMLISNHFQDLLEMVGSSIFIYALLSYIADHLNPLRVIVGEPAGES